MSSTPSGWNKPRKSHGVLLDRCISPVLALDLRGLDGLHVVSLASMYGDTAAQGMPDEQFLAEAGHHGWMVWTQDPRMARVEAQRAAIMDNGTHVFSLARADYGLPGKGFVFGRRYLSIRRRHEREGACFWRLHPGQPPRKDIA